MIAALSSLDGNILFWIQQNTRQEFLTPIFKAISLLGNSGAIWLIISLVLLLFKKTRVIGIMCIVALVLSILIDNILLKHLVERARPFDDLTNITSLIQKPTDYSFPSGHTGSSFACAGVLYKKLPKKFGIPAIVLALLIGFSRLYLGVHYPSDVLAGMAIGIIISYFSVVLVGRMMNKNVQNIIL